MERAQGIRSTVTFRAPVPCPLAELSSKTGSRISSFRTSIPPADGTPTTLEFTFTGSPDELTDAEIIFNANKLAVCRISHPGVTDCPCTCLGRHKTPISRFLADEGELTLEFYSKNFEDLQAIFTDFQTQFPTFDLQRLIRGPTDVSDHDFVLIDTGTLTNRQMQMLETAYHAGYFGRPRRTNATEIAAELDIDPTTFREHVNLALEKLLRDIVIG